MSEQERTTAGGAEDEPRDKRVLDGYMEGFPCGCERIVEWRRCPDHSGVHPDYVPTRAEGSA